LIKFAMFYAAKIHFLVEKYYTFLIYFIDLKYITVIVRSDYIKILDVVNTFAIFCFILRSLKLLYFTIVST